MVLVYVREHCLTLLVDMDVRTMDPGDEDASPIYVTARLTVKSWHEAGEFAIFLEAAPVATVGKTCHGGRQAESIFWTLCRLKRGNRGSIQTPDSRFQSKAESVM